MPGPTPLTTPNDISIALRTSTQRHNKFPIGYNGVLDAQTQNGDEPVGEYSFLGQSCLSSADS